MTATDKLREELAIREASEQEKVIEYLRQENIDWEDKYRALAAENAKLQSSNEVIAEDHAALCEHNAKLRELCATVIDDWMSKVCPSFPFCEFGGEYQDCTDETCGNQIYRQMARELGVEVE